MNIAFSTLILFLLLLPGVIFRRVYYTGDFSRKHILKTPLDIFVDAIIPGVLFQVFGVVVLCFLPEEYHLNFEELAFILLGAKDDMITSLIYRDIGVDFFKILFYNLCICILAGISGYKYRNVVRKRKLDLKYRYFRFPNDWYYILNGEVLQFPDNKLDQKDFDFIYLDVLTKTVNESVIYSGRLKLWYLEQGTLSSIIIDNVYRRILSDNHDKLEKEKLSESYFNIPGDFVVILCKDIININVRYIKFENLIT